MRLLFAFLCLLPSLAMAAVIHVPADQPTIADGITAAAPGDTVLLAAGVYTGEGNRDIMVPAKRFYLKSEAGAAVTIIDCQGTADDKHQAFRFVNGGGTNHTIEGITVCNGYGYLQGGAVYIPDVSPTFKSCVFADNSGHHGGAVYITGDEALASFYDCRFVRDSAGDIGGSVLCRAGANAYFENCVFDSNKAENGAFLCWNASPTLVNCRFVDNYSTRTGAVFLQDDCSPSFTGCLFADNVSLVYGGAIFNEERCAVGGNSRPSFTNCTFVGNSAPSGAVLYNAQYNLSCMAEPSFVNCILAFNTGSAAVVNIDGGNPRFSCTDIFGNPGGDWTGVLAAQASIDGNFSADPLFCDTARGDWSIASGSPCAPAYNSCHELIGSEDPGCGARGIVRIEKTHGTLLGHFQDVAVTIENSSLQTGGFDFLIAYDASALSAIKVEPGQLLNDLDWEYLTYRYGADGNCGDACPSGLLRIVAMAEINDGPNHPTGYGAPDDNRYELAVMEFHVTGDRTFQGQYLPIYFFWGDCGDNAFSSVHGDTMFIDLTIRNFEGVITWNEADEIAYPETDRPPFVGIPDACLEPDGYFKSLPIRLIDFINGGIDIIPDTAIDARGDVNCNGLSDEIADAVMFTNYFVMGLTAFENHIEASIAASDVNADGIALTVADLVYLIRVITGDAAPYPKPLPTAQASVNLVIGGSVAQVEVATSDDLGAAWMTIAHEGYRLGEPYLAEAAGGMTLKYTDEDGVLKVLVYSMDKGRAIAAGSHPLVVIPAEGAGTMQLGEVELADYYGRAIPVRIGSSPLPAAFALHQNHPNPFNNATTIYYELPQAGEVTIDVFNILGQRVRVLVAADQPAGVYSVSWDGTDDAGAVVASGIYIYRMSAAGVTTEKKMVLMK